MSIRIIKKRSAASVASSTSIPQDSVPQRLLTIKEAGRFAVVSDSTMRRWVRSGELRTYRAGKQIRIDIRDLTNFMRTSGHT
jgi:excisionase family DNA binding protein